ncbi:MAG: VCBS repeat-containing protein, partial [Planctomycetes bacterium]|nr:VCBS repeat-containing protein [Planctomycetota bacterium]
MKTWHYILASVALTVGTLSALSAECEFAPGVVYPVEPPPIIDPPMPHVLLARDFDGDGHLDFATANRSTAKISIVRGNGDGTFQEAVPFRVFTQNPSGIFTFEGLWSDDFDGDGSADLAAVEWNDSYLEVYLNDGQGAFSLGGRHRVLSTAGQPQHPHGVTSVDIDGDGDVDLVTSNDIVAGGDQRGALGIFKNDGTGTFAHWRTFDSGFRTQFAAAGDYDEDGDPDLVAANGGLNNTQQTLSVFLNSGDGEMTLSARINMPPTSLPIAVITADFDRDGHLDLVVGSWIDNSLCILWGDGTGSFSPYEVIRTPGTAVQPIAVDIDGDGWLDLAISTFEAPVLYVLWNLGGREFSRGLSLATHAEPRYPAAGDFDGDGDIDLASAQRGAGHI